MKNPNSSATIASAEKSINSAIIDGITEQLNLAIFKPFGVTIRAISSNSMIDGEYIYFVPLDPVAFAERFEKIVRVVKEGYGVDIQTSDIEKTNMVVDGSIVETKLYFLQFTKDIADMEEFDYSQYKEICRQVMVGKTMDGGVKLIDSIEKKTVIVYGGHESGISNVRSLIESEIKEKHKQAKILDIVGLREAGYPTTPGVVYFVEQISEDDRKYLYENESDKFVFIELKSRGFGIMHERDSSVKIRTFKCS